ncbi:MAG: DNA-directed RNA polymerase subunit beta, partial [Lachnospiraceae bacterium]
MEKSNMRPIKAGKGIRMSFSKQKEVLKMPNLIEIQKDSYEWFLGEGLREVFHDIFPIEDFAGHLSLDFVDFQLCRDDVKYPIAECKERDATYAAPMKVRVRLYNKDKDEHKEHEIFMGDLPLMTDTGSFVINGAERVIVSQLVRSPGIYYTIEHDKLGKECYFCQVIPNRGAWHEYETDSNDVFNVRVDRTRKVPVSVLLRALGLGTNSEIVDVFGDEPKLQASFAKDSSDNYTDGLLELYRKIRPGEPLSVESAESLLHSMFFDARRYDLAKVGRYKFNKKLPFKSRIVGHTLAEDVVDISTGEILAEEGSAVTAEMATRIQNAGTPYVWVNGVNRRVKVLSNLMVDIGHYIDLEDPAEYGITEPVFYPALMELMQGAESDEALKKSLRRHVDKLIPKHITK